MQEQGNETLALPGILPQRVEPGQVLVLNPRQVHANYAHASGQPWQLRSFYLAPAWLEAVAPAGAGAANFPQPLLDDPALFAALRRAHQLLEQDGYSPAAAAVLVQALEQLVHQHAQPALLPPPLALVPTWPSLSRRVGGPARRGSAGGPGRAEPFSVHPGRSPGYRPCPPGVPDPSLHKHPRPAPLAAPSFAATLRSLRG